MTIQFKVHQRFALDSPSMSSCIILHPFARRLFGGDFFYLRKFLDYSRSVLNLENARIIQRFYLA